MARSHKSGNHNRKADDELKKVREENDRQIRIVLSNLMAGGEWFRFPKVFLQFLTDSESILLAYLINHEYKTKASLRNGGWFYCLSKTIEKDLRYKARKQERLLETLRDDWLFIDTKIKGTPRRRWIKIDYNVLWSQLSEYIYLMEEDEIDNMPSDKFGNAD